MAKRPLRSGIALIVSVGTRSVTRGWSYRLTTGNFLLRKRYLAGLGLSAAAALGLPLASGLQAGAAPLPAANKPPHVTTHAKAHIRSTHPQPVNRRHTGRTTPTARATHRGELTDATRSLTYKVRPGDSLWSIAHAHGVNWFNLAADNHLEMYTVIVPGQVLRLPAPGEAAHAPMPLAPPQAAAPAPAATSQGATSDESSSSSDQAAAPAETSPAPATGESSASSVQPSSGFEQCVISRESGGNPDATNASGHWGLFQFSASTWSAYGGNPADFGSASAGEQQQVFNHAMAAGGASNWAPYDGC